MMLVERKYRRSVEGLENSMLGLSLKGTELSRFELRVVLSNCKEQRILFSHRISSCCDGIFLPLKKEGSF